MKTEIIETTKALQDLLEQAMQLLERKKQHNCFKLTLSDGMYTLENKFITIHFLAMDIRAVKDLGSCYSIRSDNWSFTVGKSEYSTGILYLT